MLECKTLKPRVIKTENSVAEVLESKDLECRVLKLKHKVLKRKVLERKIMLKQKSGGSMISLPNMCAV